MASERWKKAIAKGREYSLAHPEARSDSSATWQASQDAIAKACAAAELRRAPGSALCALMAQLYLAKGTFGERIDPYGRKVVLLGEHRDIVYVPWRTDPGNLTIGGEIYVVLGDPVPVGGYSWCAKSSDTYGTWKKVFHNGLFLMDGPWWSEIINVITPALRLAVEAAETAQKKAVTDAVTREKAAAQSRVDTWVARRSSPTTTEKRSLSRSTKR